MNVNDPAHLTEEPHERADAARRGLTAALGGRRHYGRTADHARHDARRRLLRRMGAGGRRIRRHRNGEPRWSLAVRAQEDAAAAGEAATVVPTLAECASSRLPRVEATYELPDMFVVVYDYVDDVTLDHYVCERDDDNGDGVYGSDVAISLSCATRRGTSCSGVVSMCVNRPKANPARSPSRSMVCPSTPPMRRTSMPRRCFSFGRGTFVLLRRAICVQ